MSTPAPRALIIACQRYAGLPDVDGAIDAASDFYDWFMRSHPGSDVTVCATQGEGRFDASAHRRGDGRQEIYEATRELVSRGRDRTSLFFFFFVGHGFEVPSSKENLPETVLVASDYTAGELGTNGAACVRLGELQGYLRTHLGGRSHFFFVDACRTGASPDAITPANWPASPPTAQLGTPSVWTLYSAKPGEAAPNDRAFSDALLAGLDGTGRAKVWSKLGWKVTFSDLVDFVRLRLGRDRAHYTVDDVDPGDGDVLLTLPREAVPDSRCAVHVENGAPRDHYALTICDDRERELPGTKEFNGPDLTFSVQPDDYYLELARTFPTPGEALVQVDPAAAGPLDLYEDRSVRFEDPPSDGPDDRKGCPTLEAACGGHELESTVERTVGARPSRRGAAPKRRSRRVPETSAPLSKGASLAVRSASDVRLTLRNLRTQEVTESLGCLEERSLPPGMYRMEARQFGSLIRRDELVLRAGDAGVIDVFGPLTATHRGILNAVDPGAFERRAFTAHGTMAPTANADLALWLAVIGGAFAMDADRFPTIKRCGLADVALDRDGAEILVVAALDSGGATLYLDDAPLPLRPLQELPGVWSVSAGVKPGGFSLDLVREGRPRLRVAGFAKQDYVSLFALDAQGDRFDLRQLLLDPPRFTAPPPAPRPRAPGEPRPLERGAPAQVIVGILRDWEPAFAADLNSLRFAADSQRRFALARRLAPAAGSEDERCLEFLRNSLWEPITFVIDACERVRRGEVHGESRGALLQRLDDLQGAFDGLPDANAFAALLGEARPTGSSAPLIREVALATGWHAPPGDDRSQWRLTTSGPWTIWIHTPRPEATDSPPCRGG